VAVPKATLEFELPAEQQALEYAITGAESQMVIDRLRLWLASELAIAERRVRDGQAPTDASRALQATWDKLMNLVAEPFPAPHERERHERDDDA
jgi:hypothetical protein